MERPDQVLAPRQIHRHLAANRAIDHCQQCSRHLDERHPAQIGRGGKAGYVTNYAAAKRYNIVASLGALISQPFIYFLGNFEGLGGFASRQGQRLRPEPRLYETFHCHVTVRIVDILITD